ncbi:hypothetical protein BD410DRAFT_898031 [Rickenella mellea]|uniref:RRM domain-containing protein n=1 Tax=Rickenella mellea TaxID=50990 RepID=A0A4Y7Q571_9AGAM|nr:hypothetical protein BD410DRAFT_898031 [Rickenella mellea]
MNGRPATGRINSYHGPKRNLVGNTAGRAAPAWKASHNPYAGVARQAPNGHAPPAKGVGRHSGAAAAAALADPGSKILISNLPHDVSETEVADLMKKTLGPIKDSFIVYNSDRGSKGMAIVHFQRSADAVRAREMYHGKIIDRRKPIKIEIIVDSDTPKPVPQAAPQAPRPKSLFDRIGAAPTSTSTAAKSHPGPSTVASHPAAHPGPRRARPPHQFTAHTASSGLGASAGGARPQAARPVGAGAPHRVRMKKGPRRVKKTAAQLDAEMEEYRAVADSNTSSVNVTRDDYVEGGEVDEMQD